MQNVISMRGETISHEGRHVRQYQHESEESTLDFTLELAGDDTTLAPCPVCEWECDGVAEDLFDGVDVALEALLCLLLECECSKRGGVLYGEWTVPG